MGVCSERPQILASGLAKKDIDMIGASRHKLLLSSHKGKALVVKKDKNFSHEGHPVFWFELGDPQQAIEVEISKRYPDGQLIRIAETGHGFDCARGQYHSQNEVVTWKHHKGLNQLFCVNEDLTISPCAAPNRVWGLREEDKGLVLVDKGDSNQLVFDDLLPAFPADRKTMQLTPSNFPGKAVLATRTQNHHHGMEQHMTFGDASDTENVMTIFVEGDYILNSKLFYNTLDGWNHKDRPEGHAFFTKHSEYPHQKFTVNSDGTISLDSDPLYVLGTNEAQDIVKFVPQDDENRFIFENAQEILGVTQSHGEKEEKFLEKRQLEQSLKKRIGQTYELKHGTVRLSEMIGGEKNMNDKVLEWPSDEYLDGLTEQEFDDLQLTEISWLVGTEFGDQEDYCHAFRFKNNLDGERNTSPAYGSKTDPEDNLPNFSEASSHTYPQKSVRFQNFSP